MKLVLYTLFILDMVAFSIQKGNNKSEDINAILDQLIKQTEGHKDNATKGMQFDVKEKSGNDSKIIYVKTNMRLDLRNIIIPNITGESKGSNNAFNKDDQSKYDTVSEEIVLEFEAPASNGRNKEPINIQEFMKSDDDDQVRRSAFPDDYLENDMLPEHTLDSFVPEIQNEQNLFSRYPNIIAGLESNKQLYSNNELVNEIAKDLMQNLNPVDVTTRQPLLLESTHTPGGSLNVQFPYKQESEYDSPRLVNLKIPKNVFDIVGSLDEPKAKKYPSIMETLQYPKNTFIHNLSGNLATVSLDDALQQNILYQNYLDNNPPPSDYQPAVAVSYSLPTTYAVQPQNVIRRVIHHQGAMISPETQWQTGTKCCTY